MMDAAHDRSNDQDSHRCNCEDIEKLRARSLEAKKRKESEKKRKDREKYKKYNANRKKAKQKRTRSNNNGICNESTTTGVPAAEVNEATRPGSGDISAETNKATQDESNHAGTEDLGVAPPEDKEEDTSREDILYKIC